MESINTADGTTTKRKEISDFKLERFFAKYEFQTLYLLCCSDCQTISIKELLELSPSHYDSNLSDLLNVSLGYTESEGGKEVRKDIASLYTSLKEDNILLLAGAEEGVLLFFQAFLSPSDHAIIQSPCYQSLLTIPKGTYGVLCSLIGTEYVGCEISEWRVREEKGWSLDLKELESLVKPNTKVLVVNSPHNPTGFAMDPQFIHQLVEFASSRNLFIFFDEVYKFLEHTEDIKYPLHHYIHSQFI
jgi:aspartate/methionine/tyrosine aminotransferase